MDHTIRDFCRSHCATCVLRAARSWLQRQRGAQSRNAHQPLVVWTRFYLPYERTVCIGITILTITVIRNILNMHRYNVRARTLVRCILCKVSIILASYELVVLIL